MKPLLCLASCLCLLVVNAQNQGVERQQWSIDVLLPGVTYEVGLSKKTTLNANLAFGFQYRSNSFFGDGFGVYPIGILQLREYYNFDRRIKKGKNISRNTGNYVAPILAYQSGAPLFGGLESNDAGFAGAVYGLQRTGKKRFQWNFMVGPIFDFEGGLGLLAFFKLGFVLGKKQ